MEELKIHIMEKDITHTDIGSSDMDADTKITGAYMLGEYGISDTLTSEW